MNEPKTLTINLTAEQILALTHLMSWAIEGRAVADGIPLLDAALAAAIDAAGGDDDA